MSLTLTVSPRTITGNKTKKLARQSLLPGVLYGNKTENKLVQVDYNTFVALYKESGKTHVVDVLVEGTSYPCLVHDIDVNPVSGNAVHVDFLVVDLKKKVVVTVPVELVGESPAVVQGFLLNQAMKELEVEALPGDVPESIQVSVESLVGAHDSIRIQDLAVQKKYSIQNDPEEVIVSVVEEEKEAVQEPAVVAPAEGAAQTPSDQAAQTPKQ
jgi:large subunit ribosomal protein L25